MKLSRVEIITGISKIEPLKKALGKFHITGMTVYQVLGCGVQHGLFAHSDYLPLLLSVVSDS